MGGLQSCTYAEKPCFRPVSDYFVQIVNTHPKTDGANWVTFATFEKPYTSAVKLYDSSPSSGISTSVEESIANILHTPEDNIYVYLMNSDVQLNSNDCGLYAIANATEICFGFEPAQVQYRKSEMRKHLRVCLEKGTFSRFPSQTVKRSSLHASIHNIKIYCSCRMPDNGFMFSCTRCRKWYHPKCQNIYQSKEKIKKSKTVKCLDCRSS